MKQAFTDSLKVWLTTVCVPPLIEAIIDTRRFYGKVVLFDAAMNLMIVYGLIISIPLWLLLRLFLYVLKRESASWLVQTILLTVLACISIIFTFEAIGGFQVMEGDNLTLVLIYCITAVSSLWIYRLVSKPFASIKS